MLDLEKFYIHDEEKPLDNIPTDGGFTGIFRKIACVGDSMSSGEFELTAGLAQRLYYKEDISEQSDAGAGYDVFEQSWGQYIARMTGSKVYNFSRGGMTAKEYCDGYAENMGFWGREYAAQAYIVALCLNDFGCISRKEIEFGSVEDIKQRWQDNEKTFCGYYGQIIQRYKEIQPNAKFFVVSPINSTLPDERLKMMQDFLYALAKKFDNLYVLDLVENYPKLDDRFYKNFYLRGHMSPTGYLLFGKVVAAYIDYIIRKNPEDFKHVGLIGNRI